MKILEVFEVALTSILSLIAGVAPTIAGLFLDGKKSEMFATGAKILGDLLNKPGASPAEIERDLRLMAAEKEIELKRLDIQFQLAMKHMDVDYAIRLHEAGLALALENAKINQWDARSRDKYRSRWRPTLMWGGVACILFAMFLKFLIPACLMFGLLVGIVEQSTIDQIQGILDKLDVQFLFQIMLPLLGVGFVTRGYEKVRGSS